MFQPYKIVIINRIRTLSQEGFREFAPKLSINTQIRGKHGSENRDTPTSLPHPCPRHTHSKERTPENDDSIGGCTKWSILRQDERQLGEEFKSKWYGGGAFGLTSVPVHSMQIPESLGSPNSQGALSLSLSPQSLLQGHIALPQQAPQKTALPTWILKSLWERGRGWGPLPNHMEHSHHLWPICYERQKIYEEQNLGGKTQISKNIFPLTNQKDWLYCPKIYISQI